MRVSNRDLKYGKETGKRVKCNRRTAPADDESVLLILIGSPAPGGPCQPHNVPAPVAKPGEHARFHLLPTVSHTPRVLPDGVRPPLPAE